MSESDIEAANARLGASKAIENIRRNERLLRRLAPNCDAPEFLEALVQVARADVLALAVLAEAYIATAKCQTRHAINVLGEAADKLPQDWAIELEFSRDGIDLTLRDENGDPVDVFPDDRWHFQEAICAAVEATAKVAIEQLDPLPALPTRGDA